MHILRVILIVVLLGGVLLLATSGSFLVVNDPQRADVIVVLAGETDRRPVRGLQLLDEKEAGSLLLDVPAGARIYNLDILEIARAYVQSLPESRVIMICPITGLSTKAESHDVLQCLQHSDARSILLVTSDYHTRRARSIFQHELAGYHISVAAAYDPREFGTAWWRHRQWAKLNFDEWLRLLWWEAVDRWR